MISLIFTHFFAKNNNFGKKHAQFKKNMHNFIPTITT